MQQNISTQHLKTHIGEIVDSVRLRGDRYVIERRGKPVAAIVPLSVHENDQKSHERLFDVIERIHERNKGVDPERIEAAIKEAIDEVRAPKRAEAAARMAKEAQSKTRRTRRS